MARSMLEWMKYVDMCGRPLGFYRCGARQYALTCWDTVSQRILPGKHGAGKHEAGKHEAVTHEAFITDWITAILALGNDTEKNRIRNVYKSMSFHLLNHPKKLFNFHFTYFCTY